MTESSPARAERPPLGRHTRELLNVSLTAALIAMVVAAGVMVFLAIEQSQWSVDFWSARLVQLLGVFAAWGVVVDLPLGLLRERAGWHRYWVIVLGAVVLLPIVVIALAVTGQLTLESVVLWWALGLVPALVFGGLSFVLAKTRFARRWGFLAVVVTVFVVFRLDWLARVFGVSG